VSRDHPEAGGTKSVNPLQRSQHKPVKQTSKSSFRIAEKISVSGSSRTIADYLTNEPTTPTRLAMQRSVRASAIALCALATLTACEQNSSTEQQSSSAAPDAQPGASSNRDQATADRESPQVSSPESLQLGSSIGDLPSLSSRNLPAPRARRAVPNVSATLPIPTRSNWQPGRTAFATPAPIQMPNLIMPESSTNSAIQSQPNLVPGQSSNPFISQVASQAPGQAASATQPSATPNAIAAAAMTPDSTTAIATATSSQAYSSQSVAQAQPLAQANGSQPTEAQAAGSATAFSDLQGHWSQGIVSALASNGIIQGFTDGSFRPDQLITQAQFMAMAQKAFPDEEIQPEMVQLNSGMTRASAAKAIYEALADQGRMPPISTLVAAQSLPFAAGGQPSTLAALAAAPEFSANATATEANITNEGAIAPAAVAQPANTQPSPAAAANQIAPTATQPANMQPSPAAADQAAAETASQGVTAPQLAPLTLVTPQVVQPEVVQSNPAAPSSTSSEASAPAAPTPTAPTEAVPTEAAPTAPTAVTPSVAPSVAPVPNTQATESQPSSMVAVAITGEIIRPGAYSLSKADSANGQPTLMQAIQQAGGVTPSADIRQIQVRRTVEGANQTLTVNLWQTLQAGDLSKDIVLQPGDTIAIPRAPEAATATDETTPPASDQIQVSVVGEVNSPGRRELPPHASANQAILASGGFNQQAQQAELIRLNANGTVARRSIALDLLQDRTNKANLSLQNNDVIFVQRSSSTATAMRSRPTSFMQSPLLGVLPFFPAS
jgi:protein involved in polysaccharide export with SLBB domain